MKNICQNTVFAVINEATKRFAPLLRENEEKKQALLENCQMLDGLLERFSGLGVDVDVGEVSTEITVVVGVRYPTFESPRDPFYTLLDRSIRFGCKQGIDPDEISLTFTFPGIWEAAR